MKHTRKRSSKYNNKRQTKKRTNGSRFEQIKKLVASFRSQRGGGTFTEGVCDLTPLKLNRDDNIDPPVIIKNVDDLTGLNGETCEVEGGFNRVCTKTCKNDGTEVIYRESLRPLKDWEIQKSFEEIKLQVRFAGFAPDVYAYGIIEEDVRPTTPPPLPSIDNLQLTLPPPPSTTSKSSTHPPLPSIDNLQLTLPPPPSTTPKSRTPPAEPLILVNPASTPPVLKISRFYSIMEKYDDDLYNFCSKYTQVISDTTLPKETQNQWHSWFTILIKKTMDLYDNIGHKGYFFTDVKPENLVYKVIEEHGSITDIDVRMIDFDPVFSVITGDEHGGHNGEIMKYLFCRYMISNITPPDFLEYYYAKNNTEGFKIIKEHATLRYESGVAIDQTLVNMLKHAYENKWGDLQRLYNKYNPKYIAQYSFLESKTTDEIGHILTEEERRELEKFL